VIRQKSNAQTIKIQKRFEIVWLPHENGAGKVPPEGV